MPAEYLNPIVGGDVRDPAAPLLRVLSLGAGVQSTTLALLAAAGQFDQPDAAIFADTGWEPAAVYRHLDELEGLLPFPVHRVSAGSLRERLLALPDETDRDRKRFAAVPFFTADGGMGVRQCTKAYKLYPIRDKIKELLGIEGPARLAPGSVECWIGISTDEATRIKPARERYLRNRWPLIELGMSRLDCANWLRRHGHPVPPRSSCLGCPYHSDNYWLRLRERSPAEWADTVAVDRAIRNAVPGMHEQYMHRSRVPLDQVQLRGGDGQLDLFDDECEGLCGV